MRDAELSFLLSSLRWAGEDDLMQRGKKRGDIIF
jgi:hypothetical protein